jgi:heme exporter protein B
MEFWKQLFAVVRKDLDIELRSKYAINTVLAFVGSSLLVVLLTLKAQELPPTPKSGLVWIIILFAAMSSLARTFVMETDRQTFDLLRLHVPAQAVYGGKLLYNFGFILAINAITFALYLFFLDMTVVSWSMFAVMILLGTLGLAAVSTMLAAIVSQADRKGAIFAVLSIPLLVPLILLVSRCTKLALIDGVDDGFTNDIAALIGYNGVTITAGFLLFEFIWED